MKKNLPSVRRWSTTLGFLGILMSCVVIISCSQNVEEKPKVEKLGPPYFENVAAEAGLNFTYRNGEEAGAVAILESLGGGGAIFDYDKDGLYDILLTGGGKITTENGKIRYRGKLVDRKKITKIEGYPCRLFRNLGNWKFQDVSEKVNLNADWPYSHAAAIGDYNRDGWPDAAITGFGKVLLFRNEKGMNGSRRFVEVSQDAGLTGPYHWPTSAAFADFDGDGWTDLYICQYTDWSPTNHPPCPPYSKKQADKGRLFDICSPRRFTAVRDYLYRNDGKGSFVDVSETAGIYVQPRTDKQRSDKGFLGKGLGVLVYDANGDYKPDIYVANDTTANFLYLNESAPGKIQMNEQAKSKMVDADGKGQFTGSMGVDAGDIDGKGLPSLWVTNYEQELHGLYHMEMRNNRQDYIHRTIISGAGSIGNKFVGWGTMFLDLENNGSMDLIVSNGHVIRYPPSGNLLQDAILFKNMGREYFEEHKGRGYLKNISKQGGDYFQSKHRGRGLVVGDLDNNGLPDVVISHVNEEPVAVLKNIVQTDNHWLGVRLKTTDHRDVSGAKITQSNGSVTLTRFQKSGGSYASSNDPRILFGLGSAKSAGKVTVYWPTGSPRVEHWEGLAVDTYHDLVQGTGKK